MEDSTIERISSVVHKLSPQEFLRGNARLEKDCLELLKLIYDFTKDVEKRSPLLQLTLSKKKLKLSKTEAPLASLITKNFDENQIWEEIQLQNNFTYENLVSSTSTLLAHQNISRANQDDEARLSNSESDEEETGKFQTDSEEDSEEENDMEGNEDLDIKEIDDEDSGTNMDDVKELEAEVKEESEDVESNSEEKRKNLPIPGLDEIKEESDSEESDLGLDGPDEDNTEEEKDEPSNLQKRTRRIDQEIEEMESEALELKSWQFQGEVTAKCRPENSLLEEHLIFDHLIRAAPEITLETTQRLEDIIKQRIKDGAWDDVIRKVKPIDDNSAFRKTLMLSAEKSKLSLAQIYEKEFIDQKKSEEEVKEYIEPEEKFVEEHEIIKKDIVALFSKLDALSNFHFTPRPVTAELKIVTNLPALTIEEVAPINVTEATMLAPHEIEAPIQRALKGKDERDETDRKRERRLKKKKQKAKRIAQEEKLKAKGIPTQSVSFAKTQPLKKSKGEQVGKELKTSTSFFASLQEQVQGKIKEKLKKKESKNLNGQSSAKRFKL